MQRQHSDLLIVSSLVVICAIITLVPTSAAVRLLGAVPLMLFLPGYAFMAACLPHRSLGRMAELLFSLTTSVMITALLGLVLYWAGIRLQTSAWAAALGAITLLTSGIAWRRRPATDSTSATTSWSINFSRRDLVMLGLAVMVGGVALGIARLPTPANEVSGYTSLWLVPASNENSRSYQLGLTSQEFSTVTYHLQVTVDGRVTGDWPELTLAPGETWIRSIVLASDQADPGSIDARLYRLDDPSTVYRQVKLQRHG
jgi:uncharacterized membrane protein